MSPIKVLIVDDSAFVRRSLSMILSKDPDIEILGTASDPYVAASIIAKEMPDVMTLDIEMPKMDGITFLKKVMSQRPIPTIIISSLAADKNEASIMAFEYGAISVLQKPRLSFDLDGIAEETLVNEVKAAAKARINRRINQPANVLVKKKSSESNFLETTNKVIAIGASTGGPEAILTILQKAPINCPGIVVVQHMPEMFTKSFAVRLNDLCDISVKEAENGDTILRSRALIAPGDKHLIVKRSGTRYYVELIDTDRVNRHRPSIDVLFNSVAKNIGKNAVGIILTGMGNDGAAGLLEMKNAGALTISQDEGSSVIFGMPQVAIKMGAANRILSLNEIAEFIHKYQYV